VAPNDAQIHELAGAVLDGTPIDWTAVESTADPDDRAAIEQLKLMAAVAGVHRPHEDADISGTTVGAYRLTRLLGRGGMGEVYLGERTDGRFEQHVAVKLVKRGMDSHEILGRFARERRILGRLQHPAIARLLDAGETSDGRPYFIMEAIEGQPIVTYCRMRALPLEERVSLFTVCCDAVDAAHRRLIVHRDLKPSNILVMTDGQVKLLDFGIAKLLGDEEGDGSVTREGRSLLTPDYAAPEQILGGDVTIASDVFALGVVLYEMLTNMRPYQRNAATPFELAARVDGETPERPSIAARDRRLRGDLDTIVMKALARDPERRYASAAAFADDLRRYLISLPVEARRDSSGYRLRKFVARHRLGVAASVIVSAALLVALGVSMYEVAAARREARRAAAAQGFLTSLFEQIDPDQYVGSVPTVRDILERGAGRIDRELGNQPELRADMEALLGQVFDQLALPKDGEGHWRRAVETRRGLYGTRDARTAKATKGLAISLARQSRYPEAEQMFAQLVMQEEALGDRRELGSVLLNYGQTATMNGDYAASEQLLQRSIPLLEGLGEPASRSLVAALNNLGVLYNQLGRYREAVTLFERELAIEMKNQSSQSSGVARTKTNLALAYNELGETAIAERYGQEALAVVQATLGPSHPGIGRTLLSLGRVARKRGDRDQARILFEQAVSSAEHSQDDAAWVVFPLRDLAYVLQEDGRTQEAAALLERTLAVRRKVLGDQHRLVAESWQDVGGARLMLHDVSGALEALGNAVETCRVTVPADGSQLASALFRLGDVLRLNGHPTEGLRFLEEAHAIWQKKSPSNATDLADLDAALAATRAALKTPL
jgi:serine/threonine-protein kinase